MNFYPRSPCGERQDWLPIPQGPRYFYPRSPCGERLQTAAQGILQRLEFLSTLSLRRATRVLVQLRQHPGDFYPRSPCGERRGAYYQGSVKHKYFYPRSPCGERHIMPFKIKEARIISIHALLAESDGSGAAGQLTSYGFLSTLSLRRATRQLDGATGSVGDFYPRSPCGERPLSNSMSCWACLFLSTLSLRRATVVQPRQGPAD